MLDNSILSSPVAHVLRRASSLLARLHNNCKLDILIERAKCLRQMETLFLPIQLYVKLRRIQNVQILFRYCAIVCFFVTEDYLRKPFPLAV